MRYLMHSVGVKEVAAMDEPSVAGFSRLIAKKYLQ
jgi:hypothetical protein